VSLEGRDRAYEQANTYSNVISLHHPWLNALVLNFGYHNAIITALRALVATAGAAPPDLRRGSRGPHAAAELLFSWHRNRVKRVFAVDYGARGGAEPAGHAPRDDFVGAHGVSFLTVV